MKHRLKYFLEHSIPQFSCRHPWLIIISFLAITLAFGVQLPNIYIDTDVAKLTTGSEAETRAIETAARDFIVGDPLYVVLTGDMSNPEILQKAASVIESIRGVANVLEVISPFDASYYSLSGFMVQVLPVAARIPASTAEVEQFRARLSLSPNGKRMISPDNQAMLIEVYISGSYSQRGKKAVQELEALLKQKWGKDNYYLTGTCFLAQSVDMGVRQDVLLLFPLAALIVVAVLIFSFRSWLGVLIPGATIVIALVVSLGLMAWWQVPLTLVSVVLPVILIVVGSADGIHILHKYQEELQHTDDKLTAILNAMAEMIPPCTMTSVTTAVGLLSLRTSTVIPVKDFGTFSSIGVMVAYVFAICGIPALLNVMPKPKSKKVDKSISHMDTVLLERIGRWVMKHTKLVTVIGVSVLLLCAIGIPRITVEANIARYFRNSSTVAKGIRVYEQYFGGSQQVLIVVNTNKPYGALNPQFLPVVDEMEQYVNSFPLISHTLSMASLARDFSPDGELHENLVPLAYQQLPTSLTHVFVSRDQQQKAAIHAWIRSSDTNQLATTLIELERGLNELAPEGVTILVAGLPKVIQHHMQRFSESQISSVVWSTLTVLLLLIVFYRSFVEGFLAMIPLVFTLGINFGFMGWLGIPLDAATVLMGSIAIGMGIDYSIHLISRVNREESVGHDLNTACQISIATAGHAIVINAVTLIAGFLILCFSLFAALSIFGVLMALAMGVSSIAAVTVLPALLQGLSNKIKRRSYHA